MRALRRRYQTRANVQSIFKDWDNKGQGYLDPQDVQGMLDKMGLKVNKDEAEMMIMSIDENGDNKVTLNEFLDLVFTNKDGLSGLNLQGVDVLGAEGKALIAEQIKQKAERTAKLRPMNQWKFFLQKNLNNIAIDLLTVDSDRNYVVDVKDFMRVIDRRAKIPQYLKESENTALLHEYIGGYMDD